eukprot:2631545-Rhodomonas_salina.1
MRLQVQSSTSGPPVAPLPKRRCHVDVCGNSYHVQLGAVGIPISGRNLVQVLGGRSSKPYPRFQYRNVPLF